MFTGRRPSLAPCLLLAFAIRASRGAYAFTTRNPRRSVAFYDGGGREGRRGRRARGLRSSDPVSPDEADSPSNPEPPEILPFDPRYSAEGSLGTPGFVISRTGAPTMEELSNENLYKILMLECSDLEVNTLVWKGLGYRYDKFKKQWKNEEVFPKWREKYPDPPDLIGMQRIYTKEVDQPSLKSNQSLVRSVPVDNKQSLKVHLKSLGFTGYKYAELTPNKTRRAQCANWLLYFREELFGYSVEELRERRRQKIEAAEREKERQRLLREREGEDSSEDEWRPPVTEVF